MYTVLFQITAPLFGHEFVFDGHRPSQTFFAVIWKCRYLEINHSKCIFCKLTVFVTMISFIWIIAVIWKCRYLGKIICKFFTIFSSQSFFSAVIWKCRYLEENSVRDLSFRTPCLKMLSDV